MSSRNATNSRLSLTARITGAVAAVVALCLMSTLTVVYVAMNANVRQRVDARLLHEVGEIASLQLLHGDSGVRDALSEFAQAEGTDLVAYRLLDRNGAVVAESDMSTWRPLRANASARAAAFNGGTVFEDVRDDPRAAIRVVYAPISPEIVVQAALHTTDEMQPIRDLARLFVTVGAIALAVAIAGGWLVGKRMLTPLKHMTDTAAAIANGNFDARVNPESRDLELDLLASAFNRMLDRIESFVREMRDMNEGLAHDIRTVLARIRLAAGRLLATQPMSDEQESMAVCIVEESASLLAMLDTIMDLSEMNTGVAATERVDVNLFDLLTELHDFFELTASDKNIAMTLKSADDPHIRGDETRLRRALANVLDNAIKYTPSEGRIDISLERRNDTISVHVADTGIGIPAEDQPFIFDRFYRGDSSRSSEGHGLGLSLVDAIVRLHGGTVQVVSREGKGTTVTLTFPTATS